MRTTNSSKLAESNGKKAPASPTIRPALGKKVNSKVHKRRTPTRFQYRRRVIVLLVALAMMVGGISLVAYEGRKRMQKAEETIEHLRKHIDKHIDKKLLAVVPSTNEGPRINNLQQHDMEDQQNEERSDAVESPPKAATDTGDVKHQRVVFLAGPHNSGSSTMVSKDMTS